MRYRRQYTLYTTKKGKGRKIWYFRIYVDGKRMAKTTGCTSKEKAMMYVDSVLNDAEKFRSVFSRNISRFQNPAGGSKAVTFGDYARDWWKWDVCPYVLNKRAIGTEKHPGIKKSSVDVNRMWTTRYLIPFFCHLELSEITADLVNDFLITLNIRMGLSNKTINNIRSIFLIMMNEAKKRHLIEENPVEMTLPRRIDKTKEQLLTDDEYARLFAESGINEIWGGNILCYAINRISSMTGLRAGELLALKDSDVTPDVIHVTKSYSNVYGMGTTKTSEERDVPITSEIFKLFYLAYKTRPQDSLQHGRFIFSYTGEKPMDLSRIRKSLYRHWKKSVFPKKKEKEEILISIRGAINSQRIVSKRTCIL